MTESDDGKSFLVPRNRRLTWDVLHFHKSVPLCSHDRIMSLQPVVEARRAAPQRISWPAVFLKAYGLVAAEVPELRQTWYRWPIAHIYQHPQSIGILTVQRQYKGMPWLFWGRVPHPETQDLHAIQQLIDQFKNAAPKTVFKQEIRLAGLPSMIRRLFWRWNIHIAKAQRAQKLGTFFLSTLSGLGAEIQQPPSIQTGCLTYGPIGPSGECRITLAYDHRVMDGAQVADILRQLEYILLETVRLQLLQANDPKGIIP